MPKSAKTPRPMETRHLFLDTQVYRQFGHNPKNPALQAFGTKVSEEGLVLHTTDITLAEIRGQLKEFVGTTSQHLSVAGRHLGRWRHRHPDLVPNDVPDFDVDAIAAAAFDDLQEAILQEWGGTCHEATAVPAIQVFMDYFAKRAPFAGADSKEFPDAFVLKSLVNWCVEHKEKMYVVTADKAMFDGAAATEVLIPIATLAELLEAVAATKAPDILRRADELLARKSVVAELQQQMDASIQDLVPIYVGDLADGEVTEHSMAGDIVVLHHAVIAATDTELSVLMDVRTPLLVEVHYEDRSEASYDSEDDIYFGAEMADTEFEDYPTIRVFARLGRTRPRVRGLEILTAEINVSEPYEDYK